MAFDILTRKTSPRDWSCSSISGFGDEARKAMATAPNYFVWWYTVKSVGLGVVASGLSFMLGRASAQRHKR